MQSPTLPDLAAIDTTQSLVQWLINDREAVMLGTLVAAGIVAVMIVLRYIGERMVARERTEEAFGWKSVVGRVLAKTTVLFMIVTAAQIVTHYGSPPRSIQRLAEVLFTILSAFQVAIWVRELILALIARSTSEDEGSAALGNASAVIRVLVSVALFAVAAIVVLDNLGVNVTALVAGLGIGGIAIGLAAQGIFSDLFSALAILFDKPFRRGDVIKYGTTTGTVEQIGLKTTRIRASSGEQVVMSNQKLLDQEIFNIAKAQARRVTIPFGIIYQSKAETIAIIPEICGAAVKQFKSCKLVRCVMTAFGESSLDFELVYDDRSIDYNVLAEHKSKILTDVFFAFGETGVEFAYPTQTTFTSAPDGTMIMPYPATSTRSAPARKAKS